MSASEPTVARPQAEVKTAMRRIGATDCKILGLLHLRIGRATGRPVLAADSRQRLQIGYRWLLHYDIAKYYPDPFTLGPIGWGFLIFGEYHT